MSLEKKAETWVSIHSFVKKFCPERATHKYGKKACKAGYKEAFKTLRIAINESSKSYVEGCDLYDWIAKFEGEDE